MTNEEISKELLIHPPNQFEELPLPVIAAGLLKHELMVEHLRKNTTEPLEFDSLEISDEERRKRFGAKIKLMRNFLALTQAELAEKVGVSKQAITTYETGKREPPFRTLIGLARALNVTTDWLLDTQPQLDLPF